ncbi:related to cytochrome P450 CYP3/CYP5/CYP6/CYP9 subfamilies [Phialocephala subalpina]|uniref:Related to cytochrome P450 CYP3/CYP5/CYP6/CYP9 subfamilies n=1 Tax=Phialocephala subalpina TaxID=576137 RepID=A0A1L7X8E0_9HELO|nr:related to cytochrome P450 CYP3/CYP5/CYP6/CYP9 subfamilies [Phialocephala subalpina]
MHNLHLTTLPRYEFFYDVYPHTGQYTFHIRSMHEKYGPIIRINPYELHIDTPEFYETLYSSSKKRDKWTWFTRMFGLKGGVAFAADHNVHRIRRAALNPYFSQGKVRQLQPVIEGNVQKWVGRLRGLEKSGEVVRCVVVASAFSSDVIMSYSFGRSYKKLDKPDFDEDDYDATHVAASLAWVLKHFPFLLKLVKALPEFAQKSMGQALATFVTLQAECKKQVQETMAEKDIKKEDLNHPTIFHELLNSKLPESEKGVLRLAEEAQTIIVAGQETIAWALTVVTYNLLTNPRVLKKLKEELETTISDINVSTPLAVLENLPYLSGVIKEGLRLSYGVVSRSQRIAFEPLAFSDGKKEWIIPPGTPVGMTSLLIHQNEAIYPNWREFRPERWIEDPRLDRYLVSFSKGSRGCIGMPLANAEMYLWLSGVFRRFGSPDIRFQGDEGVLELVDTGPEDVEVASDCFVPNIAAGRQGVRFRVLK